METISETQEQLITENDLEKALRIKLGKAPGCDEMASEIVM